MIKMYSIGIGIDTIINLVHLYISNLFSTQDFDVYVSFLDETSYLVSIDAKS